MVGETLSPFSKLHSIFDEMKAELFKRDRGGSRVVQGDPPCSQPPDCYSLETCNSCIEWSLDLTHMTAEEGESREVLNTEKPTQFGSCTYGVIEDWSACNLWNVVAYNWFMEGHLDPATNWTAQQDTVEYDMSQNGYKGVGYPNGHWESFPRNKGFFPPSLCDSLNTKWEVRIDCNVCDGGEPAGYMSMGWLLEEDIPVDSTCPEFDVDDSGEDAIIAMPGEFLNDYVLQELIPELRTRGTVYNGSNDEDDGISGTSGNLYQHYWSRCGHLMEDWLDNNPGAIVFIVKGKDVDSAQGRWISNMLSIDLEDKYGYKFILEDEQLHYYYVDTDTSARSESDSKNWPYGTGCINNLETDGSAQGELSCWIVRAGCVGDDYNGARFRIKDDCNNWTRSDEMVPEDQRMGQYDAGIMISPFEGEEFTYDEPVTFTAAIMEGYYPGIEEFIAWEILTPYYKSEIDDG